MNDLPTHHPSPRGTRPILLRVEQLSWNRPDGTRLFDRLSLDIGAGLSFVRGGEERGKTALLRLLAGTLPADAGTLSWHPAATQPHQAGDAAVFLFEGDEAGAQAGSTAVSTWLEQQSRRHAGWNRALLDELLQGFGLVEHLDKTLHMLSTGSRRKVALAAAFACGARLTLLEKPFAALDARSRGLLAELLQEAAGDDRRAWVLADYELPAALAGVELAATLDLGD